MFLAESPGENKGEELDKRKLMKPPPLKISAYVACFFFLSLDTI